MSGVLFDVGMLGLFLCLMQKTKCNEDTCAVTPIVLSLPVKYAEIRVTNVMLICMKYVVCDRFIYTHTHLRIHFLPFCRA